MIPDVHHKLQLVEKVRTNHLGTPAIFLGDYFDDFDDTVDDMKVTCRWLKKALENSDAHRGPTRRARTASTSAGGITSTPQFRNCQKLTC